MSLLTKITKSRAAASKALAAVGQNIDDVRADISARQNDLAALERRPQAFAEAVQSIEAGLASEAAVGAVALRRTAIDVIGRGGFAAFTMKHCEGRETGVLALQSATP